MTTALSPEELERLKTSGALVNDETLTEEEEVKRQKDEEEVKLKEEEELLAKEQEEAEKKRLENNGTEQEEEEEEEQENNEGENKDTTVISQLIERLGINAPEGVELKDEIDTLVTVIEHAIGQEVNKLSVVGDNPILNLNLTEEDDEGNKEFLTTYYVAKNLEGRNNPTDRDKERAEKLAKALVEDLEEDGEVFEHASSILDEIKTDIIQAKTLEREQNNAKVKEIVTNGDLGNSFFINEADRSDFLNYIQKPTKLGKTASNIKRDSLSLQGHLKVDYILYLEEKGKLKDIFKGASKPMKTLSDIKVGGLNKFKGAVGTKDNVSQTSQAIEILKTKYK